MSPRPEPNAKPTRPTRTKQGSQSSRLLPTNTGIHPREWTWLGYNSEAEYLRKKDTIKQVGGGQTTFAAPDWIVARNRSMGMGSPVEEASTNTAPSSAPADVQSPTLTNKPNNTMSTSSKRPMPVKPTPPRPPVKPTPRPPVKPPVKPGPPRPPKPGKPPGKQPKNLSYLRDI
jgi:hypothetical protein